MEIRSDFRELLELLNSHGVDYIVVGAFAVAHHGAPRYTGDLDVLVRPEKSNARRIIGALEALGFAFPNLQADDFERPGQVIQLGQPPGRIDLVTSITGVSWEQAESGRVKGKLGDTEVYFLGRSEIITNRRFVGRMKDLADLDALGELN